MSYLIGRLSVVVDDARPQQEDRGRATEVKTRFYGQLAGGPPPLSVLMDGTDSTLEEAIMTKKFAFIALALGLAATLPGVMPSLSLPKKTMAAPSQRIDVSEMGRSASRTMMSFDDTYQRHMGVLDVLKAQ